MAAPEKLTADNRVKIEQVAALDGSVEEMAYYCDVSRQTIYNWFEKYPELFDKVERLRAKPILKARQTVNEKMGESYANAMDYLKRKRKDEYSERSELTGANGGAIQYEDLSDLTNAELEQLTKTD